MNLQETEKLRGPLRDLIDSASRINAAKPQKYWYPLSVATYDVEEVLAAVDSLCSFRTSMWEKTADFEARFCEVSGAREGVMVNSGSSADLLIAFALVNPVTGLLAPGDEVLVPSLTWPTQIWSLMMAGLRPVFVDTDPLTFNVDVTDLKQKVSDRTRAISLVHLMGNPCDMEAVDDLCKRHDLILIEDCCEALGAKYRGQPVGTFGLASAFSFFFSHHITTMEGGMVCCDDQALSDVLRLLRAHGWARNTRYTSLPEISGVDPRYMFMNWGFNVRPTDVQAAFGLEQLLRFHDFHAQRVHNATKLKRLLEHPSLGLIPMSVAVDAECSWFAFPLTVAEDAPFTRDELVTVMEASGIETRPVMAGNLARHPVAEVFTDITAGNLPGVQIAHNRSFYIGIHPFDAPDKLERVAEVITGFVNTRT